MRIRSALAALVLATGAVVAPLAVPASAGTGTSTWCDDGITRPGGRDIGILRSPITVGVELLAAPTATDYQSLRICFSDAPFGQPSRALGGSLAVAYGLNTGLVQPAAYVRLECLPDIGSSGIWPVCDSWTGGAVAASDVTVNVVPNAVCLVAVNAVCTAYAPGVRLYDGADPSRPLLSVTLLGIPVATDAPVRCVALLVASC